MSLFLCSAGWDFGDFLGCFVDHDLIMKFNSKTFDFLSHRTVNSVIPLQSLRRT